MACELVTPNEPVTDWHVFDLAPTPLWREDWSTLHDRLHRLGRQGVDDVGQLLTDDPALAAELGAAIGVVDVNQAALDLFGASSKAEMLALFADLNTVLDDAPRIFRAVFPGLQAGARRFAHRVTTRRLDGRRLSLLVSIGVSVTRDGTTALVSAIDITEHERASRAYRTLVESALLGLAILQDGRFVVVNETFATLCGRTVSELLEQTPEQVDQIIHPEDRQTINERARARESGEAAPQHYEVRLVRPDGSVRWIDASAVVIEHDERPASQVSAVDVTERKETATALRRSEERLHEARKMEAIGRVAGGVAHDFNNFLSVIQGSADLVRGALGADSVLLEDLRVIGDATERAAALTTQLLAFSRRQVLQFERLDLNRVVMPLQDMLDRLTHDDIRLTLDLADRELLIDGDRSQIERILLNLTVNARDAMPRGGQITIRTDRIELSPADCASLTELPPGDYAVLSVGDTGAGMDEATRLRIFEPFFTTKEAGKGTGLGLSTVYGIVRQSRGMISVASQLGSGTTFTIYLPGAADQPGDRDKPATSRATEDTAATILLVEDNAQVRRVAQRFLADAGYTVIATARSCEAISSHEAHAGPVDLLLTDLVMPGLTGVELAARLRQSTPGLAVVYMSGHPEPVDVRGLEAGRAEPFLVKPFTRDALLAAVRQALGRSTGPAGR